MTQTARTYGESLYELSRDEGVGTQVLEDFQGVTALLRDNPDYLALLSLPSLPKKERCGILDESLGGRVHPYLLNFLKILVENGTIRQVFGCEEAFRRRYDDDNGILEVAAVTAVPLEDALLLKLRARLEAKTGKTVRLQNRTDPSILGGVRLEMDGQRLDGTVRSRLKEMQNILRETVL